MGIHTPEEFKAFRDRINLYQRDKREANSGLYTKKYEKTKKGFIVRLYRNMKSRIEGVQKLKHHLYKGKCLMSKEDFYSWAITSKKFHTLFKHYKDSGYLHRLAPSVDRIDSKVGYRVDNIEWVTQAVNSARSTRKKSV